VNQRLPKREAALQKLLRKKENRCAGGRLTESWEKKRTHAQARSKKTPTTGKATLSDKESAPSVLPQHGSCLLEKKYVSEKGNSVKKSLREGDHLESAGKHL